MTKEQLETILLKVYGNTLKGVTNKTKLQSLVRDYNEIVRVEKKEQKRMVSLIKKKQAFIDKFIQKQIIVLGVVQKRPMKRLK